MVQAKQGTIKVNLLPFEFLKTHMRTMSYTEGTDLNSIVTWLNLPDLMENSW